MINPTGKKLEKLLFGMFDDAIQGVDRYNHNGSLWLIFTDEMRWVVEFTKDQTLWYNYNFFKDEMELIGLDCVDNKDFIQKWFESRFLNINPVEDTIQNGVKHIACESHMGDKQVEDTIQNGVKHTQLLMSHELTKVEDTIQNGIKDIKSLILSEITTKKINNIIQSGVKHTGLLSIPRKATVEDIIQNGVKDTRWLKKCMEYYVKKTIQNGRVEMIGTGFVTPNELNDIIETNKITE